MNIGTSLIEWFLIWSIGWFIWMSLLKHGINYITAYRSTVVYFITISILAWYLFRDYLTQFFMRVPPNVLPFCYLVTFFCSSLLIYKQTKKLLNQDQIEQHKKSYVFFGTMDYRFLFSKSFDILFQQLLFLILVLILKTNLTHTTDIILTCAVGFGMIHLPLLLTKHKKGIAMGFIIASFLAGGIFSTLILTFSYGFLYAYIIHWCYYLIAGITINRKILKEYIFMGI